MFTISIYVWLYPIKTGFITNTNIIHVLHSNGYEAFEKFIVIVKSIELSFRSFAQGAQRWLLISA